MASAFDKASLVMLPNAYKDQKLYSVKPTDRSGDFAFSRDGAGASPATRVGPTGLIEKGRENLLLQSNQFDTTWFLNTTSVTSGQSGYDGTNDAWLLNSTGTGFPRIEQTKSASGVFTLSVYAKPATDGFILIRTFGADTQVWFNLNDGTVSNVTGAQYVSSSIESVGNGWYRCSVVASGSLTTVRFYPASAYGVYSTSGNGIYIQDAQLEVGLAATDYIETTTAPVSAGLLGDMPRLDYSGGAECPSLLLEPSRTNLMKHSEYANAYASASTNAIIIDNDSISPEGVKNAAKYTPTAGFGRWESEVVGIVLTNGSTYTFSMYFNTSSTLDYVTFYIGWNGATGADRSGIKFNPSTRAYESTFTTGGGTVTDYDIGEADSNGWYRVSITAPAVNPNSNCVLVLRDLSNVADGFKYVSFYGWGLEQGSYPTSYIPTYGSASGRANDSCKNTTITDFQTSDATLFFEFNYDSSKTGGFRYVFSTENSTSLNFDLIALSSTSNGTSFSFSMSGSGISFSNLSLLSGANKVLIKFERSTGAVKTFLNGAEIDSVTATSIPEIHKIAIGGRINAYSAFATDRELGDVVNQFLIFPEALSDTECINLTTL